MLKGARAPSQRAVWPGRVVAFGALLALALAAAGACEPLNRRVTTNPAPPAPTESDNTATESDTTPEGDRTPETSSDWAFKIDSAYTGGSGPRVAVIGDSLTLAGRPYLFAEFSAYRVKVASIVGEGIGGGAWANAWKVDFLAEATQEYLTDAEPPDVLVIALGTNNAWSDDITMEMFDAAWPAMVADYRGSCLVVVTATETADRPDYDRDEAAIINEKLRARADRVVEWDAANRPQDQRADGIHLTPTGLERRARFIADAVESCDLTDGADPVGP